MRMFHYIQNTRDNCLGSSPHTDWGMLTIITQNSVNGLQYYKDSIWHDVPANKNDIIINVGNYLSYISRGYFHSPIHRVECPKLSNRLSFVLFYYPGYDSELQLLQQEVEIGTTGEVQYNSLFDKNSIEIDDRKTFGDYIKEKWKGVSRK